MKRKSKTVVAELSSSEHAPYWEVFFSRQRNPFLRSQLITALMAGKTLEIERLPRPVLLDVVMLAAATRYYLDAEIIDDYNALLRHTDTEWKDPLWTARTFDQMHCSTADFVLRGAEEFVCAEDQYVPELANFYLQHDPPVYFSKELVK